MSTNGINDAFNAGFKVKLQNRGPKSSGITWELKSIFNDMAKAGLIKDTDGKGLTKQDALNLYAKLNEMHESTNRATNYTKMQVGQEFDYTADEMKALAKAAGYEIKSEVKLPEIQNLNDTLKIKAEKLKEGDASEVKPPELPVLSDDIEIPDDEIVIDDEIILKEDNILPVKKMELPTKENVESTGPANDAEYEKARLSLVEEDFNANGQVGKISQGKYYINGTEVTKEVYEIAKNKASVSELPKTYTKQELNEKISNLKPGENFEAEVDPKVYNLSSHVDLINVRGKQSELWKREDDGTLTQRYEMTLLTSTLDLFDAVRSVHYSSDGNNVIDITTDLSDLCDKRTLNTETTLCLLYDMKSPKNRTECKSQELKDKDGNVVILFKDNKFFDSKGNEIDINKASSIIEKSSKSNKEIASWVQIYE